MSPRRTSGDRGIGRRRTPFEWALLIVSLAATLVVAAGLVLSQFIGPDGPADLRVVVADEGVRASGGRSLEVSGSRSFLVDVHMLKR